VRLVGYLKKKLSFFLLILASILDSKVPDQIPVRSPVLPQNDHLTSFS
jgi:hypothetical protein